MQQHGTDRTSPKAGIHRNKYLFYLHRSHPQTERWGFLTYKQRFPIQVGRVMPEEYYQRVAAAGLPSPASSQVPPVGEEDVLSTLKTVRKNRSKYREGTDSGSSENDLWYEESIFYAAKKAPPNGLRKKDTIVEINGHLVQSYDDAVRRFQDVTLTLLLLVEREEEAADVTAPPPEWPAPLSLSTPIAVDKEKDVEEAQPSPSVSHLLDAVHQKAATETSQPPVETKIKVEEEERVEVKEEPVLSEDAARWGGVLERTIDDTVRRVIPLTTLTASPSMVGEKRILFENSVENEILKNATACETIFSLQNSTTEGERTYCHLDLHRDSSEGKENSPSSVPHDPNTNALLSDLVSGLTPLPKCAIYNEGESNPFHKNNREAIFSPSFRESVQKFLTDRALSFPLNKQEVKREAEDPTSAVETPSNNLLWVQDSALLGNIDYLQYARQYFSDLPNHTVEHSTASPPPVSSPSATRPRRADVAPLKTSVLAYIQNELQPRKASMKQKRASAQENIRTSVEKYSFLFQRTKKRMMSRGLYSPSDHTTTSEAEEREKTETGSQPFAWGRRLEGEGKEAKTRTCTTPEQPHLESLRRRCLPRPSQLAGTNRSTMQLPSPPTPRESRQLPPNRGGQGQRRNSGSQPNTDYAARKQDAHHRGSSSSHSQTPHRQQAPHPPSRGRGKKSASPRRSTPNAKGNAQRNRRRRGERK